jgi:putative tricarboxylic transport membrane protein
VNINTTKIISLLFFIFSAFYLYLAYQIQVFTFDENAPFNARTFPIYLGYAGLFFSGLKLILPDPNTIKVEHKNLEYKKTGILILIAIVYGATIFIFICFILFFRRTKVDFNVLIILSICCCLYVFASWYS